VRNNVHIPYFSTLKRVEKDEEKCVKITGEGKTHGFNLKKAKPA